MTEPDRLAREFVEQVLGQYIERFSNFRPLSKKVMINAREVNGGLCRNRLIRQFPVEPLDAQIKVEEERSAAVLAHDALNPEE